MTKKFKLRLTPLPLAVLALALCFAALLPTGLLRTRVYAETVTGKCGSSLTYTISEDGSTLTISGTGSMYDYGGSKNAPWNGNSSIKTLVLESGITYIGEYAFNGCSSLSGSLVIPDTVTEIGARAFESCYGFNGDLVIPNSVKYIREGAFYDCYGFDSDLTIGNSVKAIESYAFYNCKGFMGSLKLGNSITTIGSYAFYDCTYFGGSLVIPDSVTTVGNYAFYNCEYLQEITLGESLQTIGEQAFYDCRRLSGDLIILGSVKTIGTQAFYGCERLDGTLVLPSSLTDLSNNNYNSYGYFDGCRFTAITSYYSGSLSWGDYQNVDHGYGDYKNYFPYTVQKIRCIKDSEFAYNFSSEFNSEFSSITKTYFDGICGNTMEYTITDNVYGGKTLTISGYGAMYDYDDYDDEYGSYYGGDSSTVNTAPWRGSLYSSGDRLVLESGITHIGNYAFQSCCFRSSLAIPDTVKTIGDGAFSQRYESENFEGNLIIPDSVTAIGNRAFENCGFNGSLTIGNSVKTIGDSALIGCNGFTSGLTIPDSVISIGSYAFCDCGFTGELVIGGSVETIGSHAFSGCGFTGEFTIPASVNTIGQEAFYLIGCDTVTILSKTVGMGTNLFQSSSIKNVKCYQGSTADNYTGYPDGIAKTYLDDALTGSCGESLTYTVVHDQTAGEYFLIIEGTGAMNDYSLSGGATTAPWAKYAITNVILYDGITTIGDCAFYNCSSLEYINQLPSSLTSIGMYAFRSAPLTGSLTVPESVIDIGSYAFYYTKLSEITILGKETSVNNKALDGIAKVRCFNGAKADNYTLSDGMTRVHIQEQANIKGIVPIFEDGRIVHRVELNVSKEGGEKTLTYQLTDCIADTDNKQYIFPVFMTSNSYVNDAQALIYNIRYFYNRQAGDFESEIAAKNYLDASADTGENTDTAQLYCVTPSQGNVKFELVELKEGE